MVYVRKSFLIILLATLVFGGGYFYYIAQAVCPVPITYRLGEVDERFGLSSNEALLVISKAESVWEDAIGRNLFSYDEEGVLAINFVYDQRQQMLTQEEKLKERLDETENMTESVNATYEELVAAYNALKETYETNAALYEKRLLAYNAEVEKYNSEGGAPRGAYLLLEKEERDLGREQQSLNALSVKLNAMVTEINAIGEKGNTLISTYNKGVEVYNEKFGEEREFTQGDYTGKSIQIYTFSNQNELKLVLAHELGHALSLGHVAGKESIMHYLIGGQPEEVALSAPDKEEFARVCGDLSLWEKVQLSLNF